VRDYTFASGIAKTKLKAAVPGPLTFATLAARDEQYRSLEERVLAIADATAREIAGLKAAGATMIDIEDPAVAASPKNIELAREAYARLADPDLALTLVTYFFPVDSVLESLASFPVAGIGIDVRSRDTTAFDRLDAFRTQYVLLGVVDARNTRLETAEVVARYAERALKLVPQERLVLATTTSLEYLPRDVARAKLTALVEGARLVTGEKVPA
jgi:5-methyltetrahydropteroyltriglutamate--homocysteine methyltransferase